MSAVKVGNLGRYGTVQAKNVSFGLLTSLNLNSWKSIPELACKFCTERQEDTVEQ